ncbi:MAG: hypothetical protein FWH15_06655 [Betaproteobacteria bacterium]|nr:hypothetical protein [Betaproteobacteria bacterium]
MSLDELESKALLDSLDEFSPDSVYVKPLFWIPILVSFVFSLWEPSNILENAYVVGIIVAFIDATVPSFHANVEMSAYPEKTAILLAFAWTMMPIYIFLFATNKRFARLYESWLIIEVEARRLKLRHYLCMAAICLCPPVLFYFIPILKVDDFLCESILAQWFCFTAFAFVTIPGGLQWIMMWLKNFHRYNFDGI